MRVKQHTAGTIIGERRWFRVVFLRGTLVAPSPLEQLLPTTTVAQETVLASRTLGEIIMAAQLNFVLRNPMSLRRQSGALACPVCRIRKTESPMSRPLL